VARGIAEADSGIAANAKPATPISNNRFIWRFSLEPRYRDYGSECFRDFKFHFLNEAAAITNKDIGAVALGNGGVLAAFGISR
jgi:hypothetical protein